MPGRFEALDEGQDFTVIVDYAHTPDSLENVLRTARGLTEGRLIAVFGAATLLTGDPRFVMFKPTGINLVLGAVMLKRGWMERYAPENIRDLVSLALMRLRMKRP